MAISGCRNAAGLSIFQGDVGSTSYPIADGTAIFTIWMIIAS